MTITDEPQKQRSQTIDKEKLRRKYMEERNKRLRVDGLYAAARGNRAYADGEIRACARDPRALPPHRHAVWPVRQRAVSHRGYRSEMGRSAFALDHPHQPR